jgi:hypothetical protein
MFPAEWFCTYNLERSESDEIYYITGLLYIDK